MSYCAKHDLYYERCSTAAVCPQCSPDGIDALEAQVYALAAENAKLRAEVAKLEDVAKRTMRGEATFIHTAVAYRDERDALRAEVERAYASRNEAVERANLDEFHTVPDLRLDLARVTEERDGLAARMAKVESLMDSLDEMEDLDEITANMLLDLHAAVAAVKE